MKALTTILVISCFFLNSKFLLSQTKDKEYISSSEKAYYDSLSYANRFGNFLLASIEKAKVIPYNFIRIEKIDSPAKYEQDKIYPEFWDSTLKANQNIIEDPIKFSNLIQQMENQKIGPISRMSIIKEERLNKEWAIIYTDSKYDDFVHSGWGYWLALSEDAGKTWNKYYTGLTENYYYYFKRNSNIPLWKDSSTIQIESAIVRQKTPMMLIIPAEIEVIEDGIVVQIKLSGIIKDSDKDGLTDISEQKMLLNPYNSDTDDDGIMDYLDRNPRFKSRKSSKTMVYETIIDGFDTNKYHETITIDTTKSVTNKKPKGYIDLEHVYILVSDDPFLQQINPKNKTLIILNSKEYISYIEKYPSHFIENHISPMFKCDNFNDTFIIHYSELTSKKEYLIQKIKKGWKLFILSILMS